MVTPEPIKARATTFLPVVVQSATEAIWSSISSTDDLRRMAEILREAEQRRSSETEVAEKVEEAGFGPLAKFVRRRQGELQLLLGIITVVLTLYGRPESPEVNVRIEIDQPPPTERIIEELPETRCYCGSGRKFVECHGRLGTGGGPGPDESRPPPS